MNTRVKDSSVQVPTGLQTSSQLGAKSPVMSNTFTPRWNTADSISGSRSNTARWPLKLQFSTTNPPGAAQRRAAMYIAKQSRRVKAN